LGDGEENSDHERKNARRKKAIRENLGLLKS